MEVAKLFGLLTAVATSVQGVGQNKKKILEATPGGDSKFVIGEKTVFNVSVRFPEGNYRNVIIDVLPTVDAPDVFLTNIKVVKVGSNLHISGNTRIVMDYGRPELHTSGKALSCHIHLGNVTSVHNFRKPDPDGDVVLIQYESSIPEVRSDDFAEIGRDPMHEVHVRTNDNLDGFSDNVSLSSRSIVVTFQIMVESLEKNYNTTKTIITEAPPVKKVSTKD